jgi:hypothetical protein
MDKGTVHNTMTELNMSSDQFNLVTVAYYVRVDRYAQIPYIVAEAPSNLVLKYMRPSVWQARVMVCPTYSHVMFKANGSRFHGVLYYAAMQLSRMLAVSIPCVRYWGLW